MVKLLCLVCGLAVIEAQGQTVFKVQDLPAALGDSYRAYVDTNEVEVAHLTSAKGGPQRWDLSQIKSDSETIHRIDIVDPSDEGHGAGFPGAHYAERTTQGSAAARSWSYYSVGPAGRAYYGFFDPISNEADPETIFDAATLDLPAAVAYGQGWVREVDFQDTLAVPGLGQVHVVIHFTAEVVVDAYGTLVLPGIGEVAALRVNELHTYETQDTTFGLPLGSQYVRNYYWLTSFGRAAEVISKASAVEAPADDFTSAATVWRAFESSKIKKTPVLRTATHLRLSLKGKELFLTWDRAASASSYQVQSTPDLGSGIWKAVAAPTDNFLFDPLDLSARAKLYRVLYTE